MTPPDLHRAAEALARTYYRHAPDCVGDEPAHIDCDDTWCHLNRAKFVADVAAFGARCAEEAVEDGPPGRWICQTCGFQVTKAFLRAHDGAVGIDARPVEDVCPNDGTSLRRITWKEDSEDANRVALEQMKRADALEQQLAALSASKGDPGR